MKQKILAVTAFFAFVGFCFTHVRMVISQDGKVNPVSLQVAESELGNAECTYQPWKNNGDCVSSSYDEYCDESVVWHDCAY